jgi:PAS domain S-box-containing protein
MVASYVDYEAVYRNIPLPVLLLTPELVIAEANTAYLEATGRTQEELVGRNLFDAFPDNPGDPSATGVRDISASLARVLATGRPDGTSVQRHDIEIPGQPGLYARRYWSTVNVPVFGPGGQIALIAHCVEEITERVRRFIAGLAEVEAR